MTNKELEKIKLMAIVNNDCLKKSDAVICLTGDGYERVGQTVAVYKQGLVKRIVISGGLQNPPFCITAGKIAEKMIQKKIPESKVIIEEKSQNTFEQGVEVMKIVKEKKWSKIIIVASNFHQPRAYLTFLQAMKKAKLKIQIFNAPARDLSWFKKTPLKGMSRLELLKDEFNKIEEYGTKGHLANVQEAIEYQEWKEKQK